MKKFFTSAILLCLLLIACSNQPRVIGWVKLKPSEQPPPLYHSGFAYDIDAHKAVVFGGATNDRWSDETWLWDGETWQQADLSLNPDAREKTAMAYDEARQRTVLFGGVMDNMVFNDTWEWDGNQWQQINTTHAPPARCCHALVYDPVQEMVLLYGGWNPLTETFFNDTWVWDGKNWTETTCCGLPAASAHAVVNFSARNEVIALNSVDAYGTWAWNGNQWFNLPLSNSPARQDGRIAYNDQFDRALLFGGIRDNEYLNDLWLFNGEEWTELPVPTRPNPRYAHVLFYDMKRKSIIMFGGVSPDGILNDTWELYLPEDLSILLPTPRP